MQHFSNCSINDKEVESVDQLMNKNKKLPNVIFVLVDNFMAITCNIVRWVYWKYPSLTLTI